ncbi:MAG: helix-turn-helix transcriptional regulator [Clostridia bacterium]|nr:helix-turn-helix transcriptional regulator [Clostridia bacterium]
MENKLGKFLIEKQGGMSLREFAKRLDISHTYLDSLEKGYDNRTKKPVRITVDTLSKIAEALGEPLEKLVSLSRNEDYTSVNVNNMDVAFASGIKELNETNKAILKSTIEALLAKQEKDEENKK